MPTYYGPLVSVILPTIMVTLCSSTHLWRGHRVDTYFWLAAAADIVRGTAQCRDIIFLPIVGSGYLWINALQGKLPVPPVKHSKKTAQCCRTFQTQPKVRLCEQRSGSLFCLCWCETKVFGPISKRPFLIMNWKKKHMVHFVFLWELERTCNPSLCWCKFQSWNVLVHHLLKVLFSHAVSSGVQRIRPLNILLASPFGDRLVEKVTNPWLCRLCLMIIFLLQWR